MSDYFYSLDSIVTYYAPQWCGFDALANEENQ